MTKTASRMIPLGTIAPDFNIFDVVSKEMRSFDQLSGDLATVVMFICNHCPFVHHVQPELVLIADEYQSKGVQFIAINSNDVEHYPADAPELMELEAAEQSYHFPYLYDEEQSVARAYGAECTPDFFVFDAQRACVYRGQLDDSRPGNDVILSGSDLRAALNNLLAGLAVDAEQKPSIGCNIKWKHR
ncbi:MAG: thioredoxin family protein [Gammaproteobacteria bacterium]|nr:thioredoxin family protein [Gammaproteobacteria bacterium]